MRPPISVIKVGADNVNAGPTASVGLMPWPNVPGRLNVDDVVAVPKVFRIVDALETPLHTIEIKRKQRNLSFTSYPRVSV